MSRLRADVNARAEHVTASEALTRLDAMGNGWFGKPHVVVRGDRVKLRLPGSSSHAPPLLRATVRTSGTGVQIAGQAVESGARVFAVFLFSLLAVVFAALGAFDLSTDSEPWWVGPFFTTLFTGMAWWMQSVRKLTFRRDLERIHEALRTAVGSR